MWLVRRGRSARWWLGSSIERGIVVLRWRVVVVLSAVVGWSSVGMASRWNRIHGHPLALLYAPQLLQVSPRGLRIDRVPVLTPVTEAERHCHQSQCYDAEQRYVTVEEPVVPPMSLHVVLSQYVSPKRGPEPGLAVVVFFLSRPRGADDDPLVPIVCVAQASLLL